MRRVIVNMKDYIFADAIAQSLQADKHSDFCVQRAATPEEARQYAQLCEPYAVLLEVNANTTVKAYDLLATDEIIYNKRGLGYFVSAGAKKQIKKTRKKEFMKERLPELARQMQLLDISIDEVKEELEKNLKKIRI